MPPFSPPNPDLLFADLVDPHLSLHAVASRHNTPLADLILWLTSPDVDSQLDGFRNACAGRARLVATTLLPRCALTLQTIVDAQMAEAQNANDQSAQAQTESTPSIATAHQPLDPAADPTGQRDHILRAALLRTRAHESARRAIAMILRIARWHEPRQQSQVATSRPASSALPVASASSRCETRSDTPAWDRAASSGRTSPSEPTLGHQIESLLAALALDPQFAQSANQPRHLTQRGTDPSSIRPLNTRSQTAASAESGRIIPPSAPLTSASATVNASIPPASLSDLGGTGVPPVRSSARGTAAPPLKATSPPPPTSPHSTPPLPLTTFTRSSPRAILAHAGTEFTSDARAGPHRRSA